MKRKAEFTDFPNMKKAKPDPEDIVSTLLKEQGKNVTLAHLQNAYPRLSIALCHELLLQLKDNPELDLPGASFLITQLFLHLFSQNYTKTDPPIIDLLDLLFDYKNCQKLPTFRGRVYNNWLKNFNLNSPSNFENFPKILKILGLVVTAKEVDFFDEIDLIDFDLIDNYLFKVTEKTPKNKSDLRLSIICAVEYLSQGENFKGQLNSAYINELLTIDPQEKPDPQDLGTIFNVLGHLISRRVFSQKLSTTLLEEYLVYIDQNAGIEVSSKAFCLFVPMFNEQNKYYKHEPFKAEVLQLLIDHILNLPMESWKLANFFLQLGRLSKAELVEGDIHGIERILCELNTDLMNADMIARIFMALTGMISLLKTPINTRLIQKFMVEKLHSDKANLSMMFGAIYTLVTQSKLTGVFDDNFFQHVHLCANRQTSELDPKLLADLFNALGICLLNGHIDFFLHSELLEKLLEHFSHMKLSQKDIIHACLAIKSIANSKKFKGVVQAKMLDYFLQILFTQETINNVTTCLYTTGILARKGNLAGTIPQNTIERALNLLRSTANLKPIFVLKGVTAISDLIAKNALKIDEKYLGEMFYDILLTTDLKNRDYFQELQVSDLVQILQLPDSLSGQILHKLLPMMVHILNHQPNLVVVEEIFNALDKLAKSQHLPLMCTKHIQDLFAVFLKINRKYPQSVLKAFHIIVNLAEMDLLDGSLNLQLLKHPLMEICDEQLDAQRLMNIDLPELAALLYEIDCLETYLKLHGEIDILSRVMQLMIKNVYQAQTTDITAIADIFDSIQRLVEKEIIINAINKYDFMDEILKAVLTLPYLKEEHLISVLNGLCCLIEYKLFSGQIDVALIYSLFLKLGNLDSNELSAMYHENLHFLLQDEILYSKSSDFLKPTPSLTLRNRFFQSAKARPEDKQNYLLADTSLSSSS